MKKGFIVGFIVGAIVLPIVVVLGLAVPFFEYLKPLASLGLWASRPFMETVGDTTRVPAIAWIVYLLVNGIVCGLIGLLGARIFRRKSVANTPS